MKSYYWLLFGLFIGATIVRSIYEWLKRRGSVDPENRPLFILIALDMTILWASWFGLCSIDPYEIGLPVAVTRAGLGITVLGTILAVATLVQLRGVENIERLRTGGLFRLVRHPMYLGFTLWLTGWPLYHDAGASLAGGLFGIAHVAWWRRAEEHGLVKRFGHAYLDYRKRTRF